MAFPYSKYEALICDGAIRSGKTVFMMLAFVDDAMRRYDNQRFGICGKTVDSTVKNIIMPYMGLNYAHEKYRIQWKRSDKLLVVSTGEKTNYFELFGGKDESSFMAELRASQEAQTNGLRGYIDGQFAYYNPQARPAYIVPNPNCCYQSCGSCA